jgi:hypothetical protein
MHQTTVRFGRDLSDELTVAADRAGVSVAQFVRDAAGVRLASGGWPHRFHEMDQITARLSRATAASADAIEAATALDAERELATARAQRLREQAQGNYRRK